MILGQAIKKWNNEELTPWNELFITIFKHFPFVQPFIHGFYLKRLISAKHQMEKSFEFYKSFDPSTMVTDDNLKDCQEDVRRAAEDYIEAKEKYLEIMTDFQKMKLYEVFGESAPQAALQIGIVLQVGTISWTQIITISTSLFSLALGASDILLMMATKDKPVKEASWKTTWFLVLPAMFFVVAPRILSISLIMSYTKGYIFLILLVFFLVSLAINFDHLRRDPQEVMLGCLTNIFAPAIVIQEGSEFYKRSGITSSVLHILGLFCLFFLVFGNVIDTCPITEKNSHSPVLHCFQPKNFTSSVGIRRCRWPDKLTSGCTESFEKMSKNSFEELFHSNCESNLLALTSGRSDKDKLSYVTFCGENISWWLPLILACTSFALLHLIGILLISLILCKMLDNIEILKMSKSCFPARCFEPVWDQEKPELLEPISTFLENPTSETYKEVDATLLKKTGRGLLEQSIQNDFKEILQLVLFNLKEPINEDIFLKAIKAGSPKAIKMFLAAQKMESIDNSHEHQTKEQIVADLESQLCEQILKVEETIKNIKQSDWDSAKNRNELFKLMKENTGGKVLKREFLKQFLQKYPNHSHMDSWIEQEKLAIDLYLEEFLRPYHAVEGEMVKKHVKRQK